MSSTVLGTEDIAIDKRRKALMDWNIHHRWEGALESICLVLSLSKTGIISTPGLPTSQPASTSSHISRDGLSYQQSTLKLRKLLLKWCKNLFSCYVYLLTLVSLSGARQHKFPFIWHPLKYWTIYKLSSSHLLTHLSAVLSFSHQAQDTPPSFIFPQSLPCPLSARIWRIRTPFT